MPNTQINPYNFVSLGTGPDRSQGYPGRHQFQKGSYSGVLECRLVVLSPLVSADHRSFSTYELKNLDGTRVKVPSGNRAGQAWDSIKVFRFLRNSRNAPIIQGASLKGMIRSIYEAMVDACLPFAAIWGEKSSPHTSSDLDAHRGNACNSLEKLCPACRLFGTIEGDEVHCQGRLRFTDAVLTKGELTKERRFLRELSSPKPHHHATYGKGGISGGDIAGRKFYYHHGASPSFSIQEEESNDRSSAIDEFAPVGAEFSFQVFIDNLEPEELGRLTLAIGLDEGLGHKIGMGKAIGLGSCRIVIDQQQSRLSLPTERYGRWKEANTSSAPTWLSLKPAWDTLPSGLIEILRLNKSEEGSIGYPGQPYPNQPINARGVFGGAATTGGRPKRPEAQAGGSTGKPPTVRPDQQAAWLKEIWENELVLVTPEGKEIRRPRKAYQGKLALLQAGHWFILSGTKSVKPAR